jgi:zinc transporter
MTEQDGLIFAYQLDGRGGGQPVGWNEIRAWRPDGDFLWLHLDYEGFEVQRWFSEESGLDTVVAEALTEQETRPRSFAAHDGLFVILRGVNLNPGADPEDMVSIRMWIEERRVITLRRRRVMAVEDLRESVSVGSGPTDVGDFLVEMVDRLALRMSGVLSDLDEVVDSVEESLLQAESAELRPKLAEVRRQSIGLRRYLAPQRDVISRLQAERVSWLDEMDRAHLREVADRTTRYVEDLDSARDRAAVAHEELNSRLSEQMNRRMYALSVIAGIFLPLSFLTGLLGINVGGIPGPESPTAFTVVCIALIVLAGVQGWLFRRLRWM